MGFDFGFVFVFQAGSGSGNNGTNVCCFFFPLELVSPHLRAVGLDSYLAFRSLEEPPGKDGCGWRSGRGGEGGGLAGQGVGKDGMCFFLPLGLCPAVPTSMPVWVGSPYASLRLDITSSRRPSLTFPARAKEVSAPSCCH